MVLHICCNMAGSDVFRELFKSLREAGLNQQVFVPEKRKDRLNANQLDGIPVISRLTVKQSDAVLFYQKARRSVPVIMNELDLSHTKLIHAHTLFSDGSIAMVLAHKKSIPFGITVRYSDIEVLWKLPWLKSLGRRILRESSFIVFLSTKVKERVIETWFSETDREVISSKSHVIPNGIDPIWFDASPRERIQNPVRVGFAGRLIDRKQPLQALSAVHLANKTGPYRFLWDACGAGPLDSKIKSRLQEGDRLRGPIKGIQAMKRFYADIDLLLVPSKAETFGMVYLEAMSQGVPVLYTRGQGFDGQFPDGSIGYAVEKGSIKEMANRLIALAISRYAERSYQCIQDAKQFAWPIIAQRWTRVYSASV